MTKQSTSRMPRNYVNNTVILKRFLEDLHTDSSDRLTTTDPYCGVPMTGPPSRPRLGVTRLPWHGTEFCALSSCSGEISEHRSGFNKIFKWSFALSWPKIDSDHDQNWPARRFRFWSPDMHWVEWSHNQLPVWKKTMESVSRRNRVNPTAKRITKITSLNFYFYPFFELSLKV